MPANQASELLEFTIQSNQKGLSDKWKALILQKLTPFIRLKLYVSNEWMFVFSKANKASLQWISFLDKQANHLHLHPRPLCPNHSNNKTQFVQNSLTNDEVTTITSLTLKFRDMASLFTQWHTSISRKYDSNWQTFHYAKKCIKHLMLD